MKFILLTKGYSVMVDDSDFDVLNKHKWKVHISKTGHTYAVRNYYFKGKTKTLRMHRFILGVADSNLHIDHIDGNGLNNCRNNLRIVNNRQNSYNRKSNKNGTSHYKGVNWHNASNGWSAQIQINKKKVWLGSYKKETDAAEAYNNAAIKYFGQYAWLNIITEKI